MTGYPCALLVDHEGGVHRVGESKIGSGRLVQTLVPLLEKAGAKDVRRISLDLPILSREMDNAVTEAVCQSGLRPHRQKARSVVESWTARAGRSWERTWTSRSS